LILREITVSQWHGAQSRAKKGFDHSHGNMIEATRRDRYATLPIGG
jgi:hypothetical protein